MQKFKERTGKRYCSFDAPARATARDILFSCLSYARVSRKHSRSAYANHMMMARAMQIKSKQWGHKLP